ncbi:sulfur carrier protein ThiS [Pseudenhygromyxa sp. WMMC2535]|nr:sulfur carrier protein ThiS [Pseudenhygromyxa sp. WMMC2535]NVB41465.1 sulfur carrier protein ThiS [Pseudenhygromyxa sp. WMMC2535]
MRVALGPHSAYPTRERPPPLGSGRGAARIAFEYGSPVPTIVLNGEPRTTRDGQTVAELLAELDLDPRQVAVERNRDIVPRAEHGKTVLSEGDALEVVTFVGGG